uniref:Uncharacterized protein n=1 Tax=Tetranychus urticae TaxID=32264 RepID=T1K680_TETUR
MDVPIDFTDCQCKWDDNCWVQGRGTSKAVRGCRAHFDVHLIDKSQLINLTVEIKGPENTICFEKIKQSANESHPLRGSNFKGSPFQLGGPKGDSKGDSTLIPMWYSTIPGKISIYYIPLVIGIHKIRLFNRYAQIRGSPFAVNVQQDDNFNELTKTNKPTNCSLARSVTFCETVSNITPKMSDNQVQIVATLDKNHLSLPTSSSIEIRRSKSSELLTSKSPVETIDTWDRPSVSGTEANLFKTSEDDISMSSSSSSLTDSKVDEEEDDAGDEEDEDEDDLIIGTKCRFPVPLNKNVTLVQKLKTSEIKASQNNIFYTLFDQKLDRENIKIDFIELMMEMNLQ